MSGYTKFKADGAFQGIPLSGVGIVSFYFK